MLKEFETQYNNYINDLKRHYYQNHHIKDLILNEEFLLNKVTNKIFTFKELSTKFYTSNPNSHLRTKKACSVRSRLNKISTL